MKKSALLPLAVLALSLAGCNTSLAGDIQPPPDYTPPPALPPAATAVSYPLLPPDPAAGEGVYAQYCADCHGELANGAGQEAQTTASSPAALSHPSSLRPAVPEEWFRVIRDGSGSMPGFSSKLSDRQIWDSIAYLLSLENTPAQMQLGAEIFSAVCSQCHGEGGAGDGPGAASLDQEPADFTDQSVTSALSNQGMVDILTTGVGSMPAFGNMLSEEERWAVITYVRSLSFAPVEPAAAAAAPDLDATFTPAPEGQGTPAAPEQELVTVTGSITNDSGGTVPAGATVTLLIYDDMQPAGQLTATTDPAGKFRFENVDKPAGRIFIASVDYNGQTFSSQPSTHPGMEAAASGSGLDLPIHVYDATTDRSVVSADRLHIYMDFTTPGLLQVIELYIISNHSDRVLTAPEAGGAVLEFQLPEGATNLLFQDSVLGERYLAQENGFADTAPVLPGEASHQVLFMYDLPYTSRLALALPISLNVESVNLMLPAGGVRLKSDQLTDSGTRDSQGTTYQLFTGSTLAAGSTLELALSGKTAAADAAGTWHSRVNTTLLGAGLLLLTATGVGFYFYRRQKAAPAGDDGGEDTNLLDAEAVMDAIIALDALYQQGKIKEAAYRTRRDALKAKLKDMV